MLDYDLWQVTGVGDEQLVTSQRQAARLLNMRPSSVFYWRRIGLLGPAPWTLAELLAIKHRADAPNRRRQGPARLTLSRGRRLSRVGAVCNCPDCLVAGAAAQRVRERREAERQFPPDKRGALLALLGRGMWFQQPAA